MDTAKRKKSDVTRIFWPSHCTNGDRGLLVGWNVHAFTASVATVAKGISLEVVQKALHIIGKSKRYSHLFLECGGPPGLLGEYKQHDRSRAAQSHAIKSIRQTANFWLTLDKHLQYPRLCDIHCCGFRYSSFSVTAQFILYHQPNSSSYFSTIPFNTEPDHDVVSFNHTSDFEQALMQINESSLVEQVLAEVVGRLQQGSIPSNLLWEAGLWDTLTPERVRRSTNSLDAGDGAWLSDRWFCESGESTAADDDSVAQPGGVGAEASPQRGSRSSPGKVFLECPPWALPEYRSPANPAAESVNTSAQSPDPTQAIPAPSGRLPGKCAEARLHSNRGASMVMWTCRWLQGLVRLVLRAPSVGLWFLNVVMSHVVIIAMLSIRLAAFVLHGVLDLELPSGSFGAQAAKRGCLQTDRPGAAPAKTKACRRRLRDVSALARQLHWRLVLLAESPVMSPAAWVLLQRVTTNARTRAVLVHFNSTVSIVGIDLLLGLGACSVLMHRARTCVLVADRALEGMSEHLLLAVRWIMGVPAGLKLNDHLDFCLGNLCILGVETYLVVYHWVQPLLPVILVCVAVSGAFGLTVMLSALSDLLSLAMLHIKLFYTLAARWHGVQTKALTSLWRLFRGKKRNILRARIDACDYSLDQLLLGTLLFTLLVFLFPTTFVYYLFFFLLHAAVGVVQNIARLAVALINYCPLFAVLLRLMDPCHLPGGVRLELLPFPASNSHSSSFGAKTEASEQKWRWSGEEEGLANTSDWLIASPDVSDHPAPVGVLHQAHSSDQLGSVLGKGASQGKGTGVAAGSHMRASQSMGDFVSAKAAGMRVYVDGAREALDQAGVAWTAPNAAPFIPLHAGPSPLRANERRRSSLVGRSSYFQLHNRPLPIMSLFVWQQQRAIAVLKQNNPGQLMRRVLLAEAPPEVGFADDRQVRLVSLIEFWLFLKTLLFPLTAET